MIKAPLLLRYLKKKGYRFYAGVPCSILKELLESMSVDRKIRYVAAVRENAALGMASGAYLSGKKSCVLMQNSGLGNIVNALTSFNMIYKIPVLILMSWRGFNGKDAPEHIIMGEKMVKLLDELGVPHRVLTDKYKKDIDWAEAAMKKKKIPAALIVKEGLVK